ncbi:MAG: hypothetical protein CMN73_09175 [Sphingomonas sp.]|nr:hypothetical protein [Sphingomonas sp.]|tara:strand:+ start:1859 stop:2110 length:252 start_codon:yes stop_codon:yes gene_type:complete
MSLRARILWSRVVLAIGLLALTTMSWLIYAAWRYRIALDAMIPRGEPQADWSSPAGMAIAVLVVSLILIVRNLRTAFRRLPAK